MSGLTAEIFRRSICDQTRNAFIGLATWRALDIDEDPCPLSVDPARRLRPPASLLRRQLLVASEYGVVEPGRTVSEPNSVTDITTAGSQLQAVLTQTRLPNRKKT